MVNKLQIYLDQWNYIMMHESGNEIRGSVGLGKKAEINKGMAVAREPDVLDTDSRVRFKKSISCVKAKRIRSLWW